jgi:pimeloyl-[acyl-carrier protein] synthase
VGTALWDPAAPEVLADPYPTYRRLRETDPVHWSEAQGTWILTRHADVEAVLRDRRFSADRTKADAFAALDPEILRSVLPMLGSMLTTDPPDHERLRTLVGKAFTGRRVEGMRGRIEGIAGRLLDRAAGRGGMDVIADLAVPLTVTVIAEMLGVPVEDRERIRALSQEIAFGLDALPLGGDIATLIEASQALTGYLRAVIERRRAEPADDLLSALVEAEERGDRLSEQELVVMAALLLVAGHETTVNLIGNGTLAMLRDSEAAEAVRRDPALLPSAVEELLRFDSPAQSTARVATVEVVIGGRTVRPGQVVVCLIGAANRDPEAFEEPDALWPGRTPNPHLAFGHGIHFCLGAPLARLEAAVAFGSMLDRFPGLRPVGDPVRRPTLLLRGLSSLPVAF